MRNTALGALAALLLAAPAGAELDEALYGRLLERHTRDVSDTARVRVDYAAVAGSAEWRELVAGLADADLAALATREQKLAFWINAYNILAIDIVARNIPIDSIKDIGSLLSPVWKKEAGAVAGKPRTLHEIEHEILRPMGEPRIHVAIVCASVSCPPLRREPWTADRLDEQFTDTLRSFLADEQKGLRLDATRRTLHLSRIFDWFSEDFEDEGGVVRFVTRYAPQPARSWLKQNGSLATLRYLDYDWDTNALDRS